MAKKIQIDIEVNGKMQKATVSAKKLRDALASVDKQQEKLGKSARETDRNIKGTANASSNATKNFSKMSQGMGGLVGAYASLAASLFAVSAAFQFLKSAGELKSLQAGQIAYASATGVAMKTLTTDIIAATDAQIQFRDAAQAAAIGTAAGLNADQLRRLATAAKDASQILGRDVTDSFNRLIRGATKAEPELLDELGIILRLDRATREYKAALQITGRELTAFERTQAVTNDILTQSEEKYSRILDIVGRSPNQYAQLGKAFDDIIMKVKEVVDQIVGPFAKVLQDTPMLGVAALGLLVSGPLGALGISFTGIAEAAEEAAVKQRTFYDGVTKEIKQAQKTAKDYKKDLQALGKVGAADGAKAGFLDKIVSGGDLSKSEQARFRTAVNAAKDHVNSAGVVVKGAFTGMKIHMVNEMDEAFRNMNNEMDKTLTKTQVFSLGFKKQIAGLRAGVASLGASLAAAESKLINIVGYAGMAYTIYQVLQGAGATDSPLTDEQLEAKKIEDLTDRIKSLNSEYKRFVDIQNELAEPGSNTFFRSFSGFLGSNSDLEIRQIAEELGNLEGNIGKTKRALGDYLKIAGGAGAGIGLALLAAPFTGGASLAGLLTMGTLGAGAGYFFQEQEMQPEREKESKKSEFERRFENIQEAMRMAEKATNTNYDAFVRLDDAITAALQDPKNENLRVELGEAYKAATLFSQSLEAAAQRAKQIKKESRDLFATYSEQSAPDALISSVNAQLEELAKEQRALNNDKDPRNFMKNVQRSVDIDNETRDLLNLRRDLVHLSSAEFETKMDQLRVQKLIRREVQGETALEREQRDLANQALQLSRQRKNLLRSQRSSTIAATRAMGRANESRGESAQFKSLQEFLDSPEGTTFRREFSEIELRLSLNRDNLNDVQDQMVTSLNSAIYDANLFTSKLVQNNYNLSKQMLSFKQKEVAAQQAILDAQRQQDEMAIEAAMRVHRLKNPFYFINEERQRAQLELDTADSRQTKVINAIEQERQIKIDMIRLETLMIKERRAVALLELHAAQSKTTEGSTLYNRYQQQIDQMEGATPDFEERLNRSESAQIAAANEQAETRKKATEEEIAAKRYALELTNELRIANEEASQSLESNMTNALASFIDGSNNAKDAFRQLADSMIQDISRIVAKLLVQQAIMASMRMLSGLGGMLFGGPSAAVGAVGPTLAGGGGSTAIDDMINSFGSGRYGGILKGYSAGGIARGSDAGHLAMLHGTEAVVPLPNGRSIPVEMQNGQAQQNNVSVNVSINNDGTSDVTSENDAKGMGKAIAAAVQRELLQQKRPGGMLSPYGGTR